MTAIYYYIPEEGDEESHPNVYTIHKEMNELSLRDIRDTFPLTGVFHFRFKKNIKAVWMDVIDAKQIVPTCDNTVFAKVERLNLANKSVPQSPRQAVPPQSSVSARAPAPPQVRSSKPPVPSPLPEDDEDDDEEEEEEEESEGEEEEIEVEVEVDSDGNEIMPDGEDDDNEDTFFGDPIQTQKTEEVKPRTMSMEFLGESLSSNNGTQPDEADLNELEDLDFGAADKMKPKGAVRPKNVPPPPKGFKGKPVATKGKGTSGLDDFNF